MTDGRLDLKLCRIHSTAMFWKMRERKKVEETRNAQAKLFLSLFCLRLFPPRKKSHNEKTGSQFASNFSYARFRCYFSGE
jgi:hypothetical protein